MATPRTKKPRALETDGESPGTGIAAGASGALPLEGRRMAIGGEEGLRSTELSGPPPVTPSELRQLQVLNDRICQVIAVIDQMSQTSQMPQMPPMSPTTPISQLTQPPEVAIGPASLPSHDPFSPPPAAEGMRSPADWIG